jgi:hypothetical protein
VEITTGKVGWDVTLAKPLKRVISLKLVNELLFPQEMEVLWLTFFQIIQFSLVQIVEKVLILFSPI